MSNHHPARAVTSPRSQVLLRLRAFAATGAMIIMAPAFALAASCPPATPNIIVFLVDDLGWADTTPYGSTFYETPALERLTREGIRFTAAYAQPLCSPTRATLLTGRDAPSRLHMHQAITGDSVPEPIVPAKSRPDRQVSWPQNRNHLPLSEITIAERLRDSGYQTWHLGKWHLGNEKQFGPQKQGFDKVVAAGGAGPAGGYFAPNNIPMLTPGPDGEYICERLTREACDLIASRDPAKPFFMYFAHFNVHSPYQAKPGLIEHFKKKADPNNPQHNPVMAAMIRSVDDSLSVLLNRLDKLGLSQNTLVIFLSDNGGVHWPNPGQSLEKPIPPTSNFPLRGGKCCFYEGGIRIPFVARLPGKIPSNSVCHVPIQVADLFPTLLAYSDQTPEASEILDGENLKPLLEQNSPLTRTTLYGHFPRPTTLADTVGGSWIRQGNFKLIRLWFANPDGTHAYELYNLATDLSEATNLAAQKPALVATLAAKLDRWLADTGALIPIPNPAFKTTAAKQKKTSPSDSEAHAE